MLSKTQMNHHLQRLIKGKTVIVPFSPAGNEGFKEKVQFLRKPEQQKLGLISHPSPGLSSLLSAWLSAQRTAWP